MEIKKNNSRLIQEELLRRIETGYYGRGELLPAERRIAEEFSVSYMTARKAISELVSSGYLVRQGRQGTSVRMDLEPEKAGVTLAIVSPPFPASDVEGFLLRASELASRHGWLAKVLYAIDYKDRVLDDAVATSNAVFCFSLGFLNEFPTRTLEMIQERKIPFVLVGGYGFQIGLDSVTAPDPRAISTAYEYLQKLGHEKIAYAIQNAGDFSSPALVDLSYFRQKAGIEAAQENVSELLLQFELPRFGNPQEELYQLVRNRFQNGNLPFSAVIVPLAYAWGMYAALIDLGKKIPEDVSLMVIGDRSEMFYYRPQWSMVQLSLKKHADEAWGILEQRCGNAEFPMPINRFVEPVLVKGETVRKNERKN